MEWGVHLLHPTLADQKEIGTCFQDHICGNNAVLR
jgi:hypothetical protein